MAEFRQFVSRCLAHGVTARGRIVREQMLGRQHSGIEGFYGVIQPSGVSSRCGCANPKGVHLLDRDRGLTPPRERTLQVAQLACALVVLKVAWPRSWRRICM